MAPSPHQRIAVIGTGTVGASWAAYFLAHGLDVVATDPAPDANRLLRQRVERSWPALEQLGLEPGASPDRLEFVGDLPQALDGADYVQESAPEREDVKTKLLAEIDKHCPPEVVIASSSSGLLMSRIQSAASHPERCVIGHPFNPPHLMPLVEVVGGAATAAETVGAAMAFYQSIGKRPIHVRKEVVGHVANRIQAAIFREALHLINQGVATVGDIDTAVLYGPGLRLALMGPFLTFHLAGGDGGIRHFMDHLTEPYNTWMADLGSESIRPEDTVTVVAGVEEELGGRSMTELVNTRDAELLKLLSTIKPI